ncbi:MAG: hypothetical protein MHMPM18_002902, partial [Marteilia pararefringens]
MNDGQKIEKIYYHDDEYRCVKYKRILYMLRNDGLYQRFYNFPDSSNSEIKSRNYSILNFHEGFQKSAIKSVFLPLDDSKNIINSSKLGYNQIDPPTNSSEECKPIENLLEIDFSSESICKAQEIYDDAILTTYYDSIRTDSLYFCLSSQLYMDEYFTAGSDSDSITRREVFFSKPDRKFVSHNSEESDRKPIDKIIVHFGRDSNSNNGRLKSINQSVWFNDYEKLVFDLKNQKIYVELHSDEQDGFCFSFREYNKPDKNLDIEKILAESDNTIFFYNDDQDRFHSPDASLCEIRELLQFEEKMIQEVRVSENNSKINRLYDLSNSFKQFGFKPNEEAYEALELKKKQTKAQNLANKAQIDFLDLAKKKCGLHLKDEIPNNLKNKVEKSLIKILDEHFEMKKKYLKDKLMK